MMDAAVSGEVTQLLLAWRDGDESALERLLPLVYEELRRLAHHYLRRERAGHTLQTTALVNEAYLRLVRSSRVEWQNRAHFFAVAAQLMRRVLVDEARQRGYLKQGGAFTRVALAEDIAMAPERNVDLMALDEALGRLEQRAPRKCRVIELRFFGGLSIEETATVLGVHADTVKREWRTAKLWLWRELSGAKEASDGTDTLESD
jgi:RNA polymerase sigma factor (TIGR02999 family)